MTSKHLIVALFGLCLCNLSLQSSPYFSLQPAVEALTEREAQLALRNEIENGNLDDFADTDFEWNDDYDKPALEPRLQLPSKGRYLTRSNQDYEEDFYPSDYRKRAMYQKRDASVFRERSRVPNSSQQQQALAEKFLRAIENEREREEEEEYKKQLRNLWNRYQVEEGDIEKELFDNDIDSDYPLNSDDINRKRNRKVGSGDVASYYSSDNKRSMPMLPWLPATRKKRFPVTKRSPKALIAPESTEKVSQDLKGIFGASNAVKNGVDESKAKKKRSSDETHPLLVDNAKKTENPQTSMSDSVHVPMAEKKRKREVSDPDEEDEPENENDEEADEETAEDGDDSSEDESRKKKKKREASTAKKSLKIKAEKQPFQWSSIFGLDRKKKSIGLIYHPLETSKRCGPGGCEQEDYAEEDYEDEDYRRKKKRSRGEKLDTMDRKLKTIENLIIEDTAKYYDNHDGSLSSSEGRALRNRVAERLATAYSLEKMRKAIGALKQSMAMEKNLERNLLQGAHLDFEDDDKKKAKRVAIKKEKAEFNNQNHDIDSPAKKASSEHKTNELNEEIDGTEKKKRSQKKNELRNSISDADAMSEGFMGGKTTSGCPLLDGIEKKCRGIDIMSGDASQDLLEACGVHQLCYLCGESQLQCDYQYLNDAEEVCGGGLKCKIAAREALTVLRSLGGHRIASRECFRNPCLSSALQSIAY